jgi:SAM-dependent methyltransferase
MKNKQAWEPSKYIPTRRGWRMSRDPALGNAGSRFLGDIVVEYYERALREHARGTLLDLGSGNVPLYGIYRDYVDDNVCVDWPYSPHASEHVDLETDLNEPIPLPDAGFDTVLVTDVLEHIANPSQLWREISRLLKPGGKVIVGVPFLYCIHEEPHDYHRYTEYKLRMDCEGNGLGLLSLEPYGGAPEVILDIIAKLLSSSRALSRAHHTISTAIMKTSIARNLSRKTSRRFPIGYTLVAQKA